MKLRGTLLQYRNFDYDIVCDVIEYEDESWQITYRQILEEDELRSDIFCET